MLRNTTIDHVVAGGPAYNTKEMQPGDEILAVGGKMTTSENIHDLLIGNDIPGSMVDVLIAKGGIEVHSSCFFWW
jgi:C-terminal processing protease CtpA/Prc